MMGHIDGTQEGTERAPNGQSWNNLNKTKYYWIFPKHTVNIHESIVI